MSVLNKLLSIVVACMIKQEIGVVDVWLTVDGQRYRIGVEIEETITLKRRINDYV